MTKLLLILMALGALAEGLSSSKSDPPLLIDASQPAAPALDAYD